MLQQQEQLIPDSVLAYRSAYRGNQNDLKSFKSKIGTRACIFDRRTFPEIVQPTSVYFTAISMYNNLNDLGLIKI